MKHQIVLLPGDGIGPEIAEAVRRILDASGVAIEWFHADAGLASIDKYGDAITDETLALLTEKKVALKGPTTTPVGGGHRSINVLIRKTLGLFANVRMVRTLPGVKTRFEEIDLVVVRENIEDTYGGLEYMQTADVGSCLKFITRQGTADVVRYSFEYARQMGRKRVTAVHKANIHKLADGMFLDTFREIAAEYSEIAADDIIVDNVCMQLVTKPTQFDVLVLPNLYGDIVSDLCAGLIGGLGVAPGSNIGHKLAIFEAVHGSAPDIAGKGIANPTALLQSAIHMLRHLGELEAAAAVEKALHETLAAGEKTGDLGGKLGTTAFADAIISRLTRVAADRAVTPVRVKAFGHAEARTVSEELCGVDIYVKSTTEPVVPAQVGALTYKGATNRGAEVTDANRENLTLVDWWRCRWMAEGSIGQAEIVALLGALGETPWMHVEKLTKFNGKKGWA